MKLNNILMISYFSPPINTPAAIRVGKFANYLPAFGWKATILTVKELDYYHNEPELFPNLKDEEIIRTNSLDPMRLLQMMKQGKQAENDLTQKLHRGGEGFTNKLKKIFPVDDKIGWLPFCWKKADKLVRQHDFKAIYCTIGGTNAHAIAAYKISVKYKIPLLIDIRDPWADHIFTTNIWYNKILNNYWEKKVYSQAAKLITVTARIRTHLLKKYNFPEDKISVIYNGYDDFSLPQNSRKDSNEIVMTFAGNMYKDISPEAFYQALADMDQEIFADKKISLRFIGNYRNNFYQLLAEFKTTKHENIQVEVLPFMSKKELNNYLVDSDVLMIFLPQRAGSEEILTTKLFDYLPYKKPILAFAPAAGELAEFIQNYKLGLVIDAVDKQSAKERLQEFITKLSDNKLPEYSADKAILDMFHRKELTRQLSVELEKLL